MSGRFINHCSDKRSITRHTQVDFSKKEKVLWEREEKRGKEHNTC